VWHIKEEGFIQRIVDVLRKAGNVVSEKERKDKDKR
jgi:hypothetical protein